MDPSAGMKRDLKQRSFKINAIHGQIRGHLKGWFLHSQASVIKPELQVLFTDATAGGWGGDST